MLHAGGSKGLGRRKKETKKGKRDCLKVCKQPGAAKTGPGNHTAACPDLVPFSKRKIGCRVIGSFFQIQDTFNKTG